MLKAIASVPPPADTLRIWRFAGAGGAAEISPAEREVSLDSVAQHFLQRAPAIRSIADLVDDATSRSFLQQALGLDLDPHANAQAQAELISAMLSFREFQIPSRLQQFIQLYIAQGGGGAPEGDSGVHGPMLPSQAAPVSETLLAQLQSLRIGGA